MMIYIVQNVQNNVYLNFNYIEIMILTYMYEVCLKSGEVRADTNNEKLQLTALWLLSDYRASFF